MTTRKVCGRRLLLLPAVLLLPLLAMPALAGVPHRRGILYTSYGQIQEAQRILEADNYLQPGTYKTGEMDQSTIEALENFQRNHDLPTNGMLDHDTMAELTTHGMGLPAPRVAAAAPPVQEPVKEPEPAPAPAPEPARTEVQEQAPVAPAPVVAETQPAPAEEPPAERPMPATASPIPLMAVLGAVLLGAGLLLVRRKEA